MLVRNETNPTPANIETKVAEATKVNRKSGQGRKGATE